MWLAQGFAKDQYICQAFPKSSIADALIHRQLLEQIMDCFLISHFISPRELAGLDNKRDGAGGSRTGSAGVGAAKGGFINFVPVDLFQSG